MIITLRQSAIFLLILLNCATPYAAPVTPVVPLLLSAELDENNTLLPVSIETTKLIRYLESSIGLKFEIRRYPWKRAMENTLIGEGIIYGISKTPERLRKFSFSESTLIDQTWLVTLCDSTFPFNTLQDLKGKTIGVVRGTSSGDEFDQDTTYLKMIDKALVRAKSNGDLARIFSKEIQFGK